MGEEQAFQQMVLGNWRSTCRRMKLDPHLRTYINVNSKWIRDLNVRPKTIKLSEENIQEKLCNIGFGNDFLDMTPKVQAIKAKIETTSNLKLLHNKGNN